MPQPTTTTPKRRLKVNFHGSTLKITGAKTGVLYTYVPEVNHGVLEVNEADVPELLKMTFASGEREDFRSPYFSL